MIIAIKFASDILINGSHALLINFALGDYGFAAIELIGIIKPVLRCELWPFDGFIAAQLKTKNNNSNE